MWDVAIVGGGAAGMATAIFLLEEVLRVGASFPRILILEGARKPGAKILVSGGGRCNVTHRVVKPEDYQGGNQTIIRNILRAFTVEATLEWMEGLGVELKLETTGKWFPTTNRARTVLDALLRRIDQLGATWVCGTRVTGLSLSDPKTWKLECSDGLARVARRVVVATGGLSLPKSGSDGWGLQHLRRMGHRVIEPVPALVPLTLSDAGQETSLTRLSGLTLELRVRFADSRQGNPPQFVDSTLVTHSGLSGPAPMYISRWVSRAWASGLQDRSRLSLGLASFPRFEDADRWILDRATSAPTRTVGAALQEWLPERMAAWWSGGLASKRLGGLTREERRGLATLLADYPLPINGTRGFTFAETTAGGVALEEIDHRTMESRLYPGLTIVGEILDADGRIGGFNFQWAWCTARIAGRSLAKAISGKQFTPNSRPEFDG